MIKEGNLEDDQTEQARVHDDGAARRQCDRIAVAYRSIADGAIAIRDAMKDGDADRMMLEMTRQRSIAMRASRTTEALMIGVALIVETDRATFDAANRRAPRRSRSAARSIDMPLDDLVAELDHHAKQCDGVGCVSHEILNEEVARRAPH